MSVGMQVLEDRWDEIEGKDGHLYEQRTIIRAKLFDVSAVTYPAYEETDAGVREADLARELRDARGVAVHRRELPQDAGISFDRGHGADIRNNTFTGDSTPAPTPPQGGETPESSAPAGTVPSSSGPATATSIREGVQTLADSERPIHELLSEHAFTDEHRKAPRLMCPACSRPATATA
jgi:hypothetical protein